MSKNPFDAYILPVGMTAGVDIPLPGTPAVFKVVLPGAMNEDFQMDLMSAVSSRVSDEEGTLKISGPDLQKERKKLFLKTCIISATGLPDGMTPEEFLDTYRLAAKHLYDTANTMGGAADEVALEALEKLKPMQSGGVSGVGKQSNTKTPSKAESTSPQPGLN